MIGESGYLKEVFTDLLRRWEELEQLHVNRLKDVICEISYVGVSTDSSKRNFVQEIPVRARKTSLRFTCSNLSNRGESAPGKPFNFRVSATREHP